MFKIDHINLSVSKLPESISFYKLLGFKVKKKYEAPDKSIRMVLLEDSSGMMLELFNYSKNFKPARYTKSITTDLPVIGVKHFALSVKDINKAEQFIKINKIDQNIKINDGKLGRKYFFVKDPNGIFIEFIESC